MMRASHRQAVSAALFGAVGALWCASAACGQPAGGFPALLADAGVDGDDLASLAAADWNALTEEQAATAGRVLFRLEQLKGGGSDAVSLEATPAWDAQDARGATPVAGTLLRFEGVAVASDPIRLPSQDDSDADSLWRCDVELPRDGGMVRVIVSRRPRPWLSGAPLPQPVEVLGVYAGPSREGERVVPVVMTDRFRWYPTSGVPSGLAWLAANRFDAALLDEVRPVSAFGKLHESRESEAFYAALAAVGRGNADELMQFARQEVRDAVDRWRELAEASSSDAEASKLNARIADAVARSAERGVSSVGPMYLAPADTMGRLVLVDGVARRAVRIVVDDGTAPDDLAEYFELDVFTSDSENLPVICAVTRLPAGFPTGDRIHAPVRVAGVFFKRWAYLARPDAKEGEAAQRMAAPLVLAAEPEWLRTVDAAPVSGRGIWWGLAFVAVLGLIWLAAARAARSDRLARSRRTGYDAESGVKLGPPSAEQ